MDLLAVKDPLAVLQSFREDAEKDGLAIPDSMTLATLGLDGTPRARVVLWKGQNGRTLQFFTNYESDKAQELEACPRATLLFHYANRERQVRVVGSVQKLSPEESDAYFAKRPLQSQIGAWASDQSRPLNGRFELEGKVAKVALKYLGRSVPRPPHWGGYGVLAESVELWLGQPGRLHVRARYDFRDGAWQPQMLYP